MFVVLPEDYYNDFPKMLLKRKAWQHLLEDPQENFIQLSLMNFGATMD